MRLLLVEDGQLIGEAVRDHMRAAGHAVDWVMTLTEARHHVHGVAYDVVLLDLSLPDGSGLALLQDIRKCVHPIGVIVLTAHDRLSDRISGLDAGADDYLVKPFELDELVARVRAVARRKVAPRTEALVVAGVELERDARTVRRDGLTVAITGLEWSFLDRLSRRPGATVTRAELEHALYDLARDVDPNAIEALVSRLRKKLGQRVIVTVRGIGYRLGDASPA